jgi:hypothetical protein
MELLARVERLEQQVAELTAELFKSKEEDRELTEACNAITADLNRFPNYCTQCHGERLQGHTCGDGHVYCKDCGCEGPAEEHEGHFIAGLYSKFTGD